jgi:cytochrome b561
MVRIILECMESEPRYTRPAVLLHWAVAAIVVAQYPLGWWMQTLAKQPPGPRAEMFNLHKSIGLAIFALMIVRLGWRLGHPPPLLPPMPRWQVIAARGTHWLLYAVLIGMPLTGYLGSVFSGYPVKFFGVTLPSWAAKNVQLKDGMSTAHWVFSWGLLGAFGLHMLGVLKHEALEGDGLVRRMSFSRTARPRTSHLRRS